MVEREHSGAGGDSAVLPARGRCGRL